jgi:hypothetical protein
MEAITDQLRSHTRAGYFIDRNLNLNSSGSRFESLQSRRNPEVQLVLSVPPDKLPKVIALATFSSTQILF